MAEDIYGYNIPGDDKDESAWTPTYETMPDYSVSPEQTVSYQLSKLIAEDNPYIQAAQTAAAEEAAARGTLHTGMAVEAGTQAAIESALPIAQQDAATYATTALSAQEAGQEAFLQGQDYFSQSALQGEQHDYSLEEIQLAGEIDQALQAAEQEWATGERESSQLWETGERESGQEWETGERIGGQAWESGEREAGQEWATGERLGAQEWESGEGEVERLWQTGERLGEQEWSTGERREGQEWETGERLGTQEWETGERLGGQEWATGERLGEQSWLTGEREAGEAFTTSERESGEAYATSEREAGQDWTTGEREAGQEWENEYAATQHGYDQANLEQQQGYELQIIDEQQKDNLETLTQEQTWAEGMTETEFLNSLEYLGKEHEYELETLGDLHDYDKEILTMEQDWEDDFREDTQDFEKDVMEDEQEFLAGENTADREVAIYLGGLEYEYGIIDTIISGTIEAYNMDDISEDEKNSVVGGAISDLILDPDAYSGVMVEAGEDGELPEGYDADYYKDTVQDEETGTWYVVDPVTGEIADEQMTSLTYSLLNANGLTPEDIAGSTDYTLDLDAILDDVFAGKLDFLGDYQIGGGELPDYDTTDTNVGVVEEPVEEVEPITEEETNVQQAIEAEGISTDDLSSAGVTEDQLIEFGVTSENIEGWDRYSLSDLLSGIPALLDAGLTIDDWNSWGTIEQIGFMEDGTIP